MTNASVIGARASVLREGEAKEKGTLRVVPLVGPSGVDPAYRLLGPDTADKVEIKELGGGSVPKLRIVNTMDEWLFIVDSQAIIGLKQNRSLNVDVLIRAGGKVTVPVSCVEAGRWGSAMGKVISGDLVPRRVRSRKMRSVSRSLESGADFCSDQGEVWDEVALHLSMSRTPSGSSAIHDLYEKRREALDEARQTLTLPEDAVGVAVFHGERFVGLDLFDRASTMRHMWNGVLDSYVLDWMIMGERVDGPADDEAVNLRAEEILESLTRMEWSPFDSPGDGVSMRSESSQLTASACVYDDRQVIHLQAFPRPKDGRATMRDSICVEDSVQRVRDSLRRARRESVGGDPAGQRCPRCGFDYAFVRTPTGLCCNHCGHDERVDS